MRFIGQYTRFENPDENMIPPPTDGEGVMRGSSMNMQVGTPPVPPPLSPADMPVQGNPFDAPAGSDMVPF